MSSSDRNYYACQACWESTVLQHVRTEGWGEHRCTYCGRTAKCFGIPSVFGEQVPIASAQTIREQRAIDRLGVNSALAEVELYVYQMQEGRFFYKCRLSDKSSRLSTDGNSYGRFDIIVKPTEPMIFGFPYRWANLPKDGGVWLNHKLFLSPVKGDSP